jgi:hypothetical protein
MLTKSHLRRQLKFIPEVFFCYPNAFDVRYSTALFNINEERKKCESVCLAIWPIRSSSFVYFIHLALHGTLLLLLLGALFLSLSLSLSLSLYLYRCSVQLELIIFLLLCVSILDFYFHGKTFKFSLLM